MPAGAGNPDFARRLAVTGAGGLAGVVGTLVALAADRSLAVGPVGVVTLLAVALAVALAGAAATRRWVSATVAAILAGVAVPGLTLFVVVAACLAGAGCD